MLIIVTDDQDENHVRRQHASVLHLLGREMKLLAREVPDTAPSSSRRPCGAMVMSPWTCRWDAELGQHLIEYLTESDFDIAHGRYLNDEYGGAIGPAGYVH